MTAYATRAMAALGDDTRRAIFELLGEGPRPVGVLSRSLPVSRPAVSQHLKVLKDAGLVVDRPEGTRRIYRVNPDTVAALRAYFDRFWNRSLADFKEAAEREAGTRTTPSNTTVSNANPSNTTTSNSE